MEKNALDQIEQEEDAKNIKKGIMFFVAVVILGVVGFCEVLYVAMIIPAFPDGLVRLIAIVGACATGLSAVLLLVGKLHWFSKGPQGYAAWAFVASETAILVLNVLLAVQLHDGHVDGWLMWWMGFYPAAPIVAFVGWGVILYLDKSNKMRALRREQMDRQEQAQLSYEHLVHKTQMQVKNESMHILAAKLQERIQSAETHAALDRIAHNMASTILGEISGQRVTTSVSPIPQGQLPPAKSPSVEPASFAQTAQPSILARNDQETGPLQGSFPPVSEAHYRQLFNMWAKETQQPSPLSQPLPENDQQASQ